MGIDPGEKVSNRAERQAKRKFTLDLIVQTSHKRQLGGHCSSPRPLKGPPTARDGQTALVSHSSWGGRAEDEGESEGRSP